MNNSIIRRALAVLLALLMVFSFCGCNAGVIVHNETIADTTELSSVTINSELPAESDTAESGTAETDAQEVTERTTEDSKASATEPTTAVSTADTTTVKASTTKANDKPAAKTSTTKSTTKTNGKTTTKPVETQPKKADSCTITIQCKAILSSMDKLKKGHEQYVPDDGMILCSYSVEYQDGDTAYDILKRACSENQIKLSARNTQYGTYVSGINNLDEFDCGSQSGWLYYVNGKSPGISCGKYKVSPDDKIEFSYTVDG